MTAASTHDLQTASLDYPLPESRIATRPAEPRDAARLFVYDRESGERRHGHVRDLPELLGQGDHLVVNDTSVHPALLEARRAPTGGRVEGLFLGDPGPGEWRVMLKSNGRLRVGDVLELLDESGRVGPTLELLESEDAGVWRAHVNDERPTAVLLARVGRTPLPPYIRRSRHEPVDDALDRVWYETVYADPARRVSVAAPTAGLHFTPSLLDALETRGVGRSSITLHVGPGTFRPIATDTLGAHVMHTERYEVPAQTLDVLRARESDQYDEGRVVAVGTTVVRALESIPTPPPLTTYAGATDLLIAPPYAFRHVDALLTNFHLPRSTLLALVAAMVGLERLHELYREAIELRYRFYSYGDAMLIL